MTRFRRLAATWCLAALAVGQTAQAKVLVVYPYEVGTEGSVTPGDGRVQMLRNVRNVLAIIRATGGTPTVVRSDQTRTEWVRMGQQVWNSTITGGNTAGSYVEQFDATAVFGEILAVKAGQFRTDSLGNMRNQGGATRLGNAVPMLRLLDNAPLLVSSGTGPLATLIDSSGTSGTSPDGSAGSAFMHFANDPHVAMPSAYVGTFTGIYETGDLRRILYGAVGQGNGRSSNGITSGARVGCRFCDSLASLAANDSLILWDRQFSTRLGQASTMSYVSAWGAGAASDSLNNLAVAGATKPGTEGAWEVVLAGLAHLDSLSGHKVLGDKVIKIAPVVYGGLARGARHSWNWNKSQGIFVDDTTAFYAYLDSINALGIPITFAVNVDSAATYARDVIKLKSVANARFTPQVWDGVDDTTLTAYSGFPKDIFGRYNRRAAYGDSASHALCNGGADSSIYWQARRARVLCDSIFGNRTSRVLAAPADDWSPLNLNDRQSAGLATWTRVGIDSVLWALRQAGFVGIIADAQDPDANGSKTNAGPSKTNPRGYYNTQGVFTSGSIPGFKMNILCHSGFNTEGGRGQLQWYNAGVRDSSTTGGGTFIPYRELGRLWSSALLPYDESYDNFSYDANNGFFPYAADNIDQRRTDRFGRGYPFLVMHGNIYRLSCADLSGKQTADLVPAATCYHVLKGAANAMYIINKLAGRTVVRFAYPEDIDP